MIAPLHSEIGLRTAAPTARADRIIVVFRNDDPSAISDLAHEQLICAMFEEFGVPQTIGVIPNVALGEHRDPNARGERSLETHPEMVALLRRHCDVVGSEIALHGYTHRTSPLSIPARREFFEFRDEDAFVQGRKLARGMEIVEKSLGVRPLTFIPPWNRLDRGTVAACGQNGLSIVSAGAFAPVDAGMAALGTDCDLFNFPAFFEQAAASDQRIFLRILFHSCTTRTPQELAALRRALELATSPQCRVMTIAQAVRAYPAEIAAVNEAGRNVIAQDMLHGSTRASAELCRRAARTLKRPDALGSMLDQSARLYRAGRYHESAQLGVEIDRAASRLVMRWLLLVVACGFVAGVILSAGLWSTEAMTRLVAWAALVSATVGVAELLRKRATAPDTRRMIRTSGWAAILGVNGAFVVAELIRDQFTL